MAIPTPQAKRVLIVDDEPTLVFFLMQGLRDSEIPYEVNSASSAEEALAMFTLNQYDLLITDLKMPDVNGLTLIEVARSLQYDISVILMTAFGSREVQNEASRLEVDGYLTKPFATVTLREMASKILSSKNDKFPSLASQQDSPPSHSRLKRQ